MGFILQEDQQINWHRILSLLLTIEHLTTAYLKLEDYDKNLHRG